MKQYEAMFILKSDLEKEAINKVIAQIQDAVTRHKGVIDEIKEWGRCKLAYPIKKYKEGTYYLANFNIEAEHIKDMKKGLSLNDSILRLLITTKPR